ncbi:class I SAM-dependent methyltransferase [Amycolatopsis granulosa]|uniref:class I SAM-dependent methyltransferase n=1 Tax=Amycolatopsis granulosa TaxID=185684 RepID=UPI0014237AAB|nr:class I SAM-dependent methyltransferase [Amycolatopsis granulosa]NIH86226.1 SAM-dependent methyltransferase [Amycolatopsis granulosa]
MACEHPLAYVLALEGRLLDDPAEGVEVAHVDPVEGYDLWAPTYDSPNPAFGFDEPFVRSVAAGMPPGVALDAACGAGRVTAVLAGHGHRVIGVDGSPGMLAEARKRLPDADFRHGELASLPVDTASVDLVTCSLALTHVPGLGPVFAEFARVLRPRGRLVVADVHPEQVARGHVPAVRRADATPGRVRSHCHRTGDYLRAALAAGLTAQRCAEPGAAPRAVPPGGPGPWEAWPWSLAGLAPAAAEAAGAGVPSMILWEFRN